MRSIVKNVKRSRDEVVTKKETYDVCGEAIEVDAQVLICEECGEEFYYEEFDNATLIQAYNEYRRKHKLLFPEEIKKIREQYGLSQRSFAKLLNWEIRQYAGMKMDLFRIKRTIVFCCFCAGRRI